MKFCMKHLSILLFIFLFIFFGGCGADKFQPDVSSGIPPEISKNPASFVLPDPARAKLGGGLADIIERIKNGEDAATLLSRHLNMPADIQEIQVNIFLDDDAALYEDKLKNHAVKIVSINKNVAGALAGIDELLNVTSEPWVKVIYPVIGPSPAYE